MITLGGKLNENAGNSEGIFVEDATIVAVKNQSYKTYQSGREAELLIEVEFKKADKDFNSKVFLSGGFVRDPQTNEITGLTNWSFKLERIFQLFEKEIMLTADAKPNFFPDDLRDLIGKSVRILSYRSTKINKNDKNSYFTWDMIYPMVATDTVIKREFLGAVNKGYVKDYAPTAHVAETTQATAGVGQPGDVF